jgi:type I restriction-modification system DNA methylase subunit
MTTNFDTYLAKIEKDLCSGKATEHTYRSTLEAYMESVQRGVDASNDPKHIECGAPDFVVEKGKVPLGYVETKDVGVGLDHIEKTDQLRRYLKALNNLILTDYLEFRWYVNGEHRRTLRVADVGGNQRLTPTPQAAENLEQLFKDFYATEAPTVSSPKELANRLAAVTHFVRDQIKEALASGDAALQTSLESRYHAFRELLLPALKPEEFADLYAQTMTYGLFAAKLSAPENAAFTLAGAYQFLFGNKFLRRLFSDVSEELDEIDIIRPYLQDIVSLLNRADFHAILADFGKRTRTEDPVVHFYETFLAAYDPKLRQSRGVYYTPEPVVQFIVRAVDDMLKTRFGKPWGLADASVKVLDPAAGTGTFLYYVIQQIHEEVATNRQQAGQWAQRSKELLQRLFGFELLIAPYVVAHLKLGLLLQNLGAPLEGRDERLHVYLTNSLEEGITRAEHLAGLGHYIAEEASDAAQVKKQADIMVVLGNPPYSGHSANASKDKDGKPNFIGKLLNEYYFVDGAPLGERNPKWLQDDYVKFIRFGEWRIQQTGYGVLAFITNHGYLDNPTFRGMRQHLMKTFDEIFVLDLHGNSKKKEKAPGGGKDENVFDIQQGVAILLAVKNPQPAIAASSSPKSAGADLGEGRVGVVRHAALWGLRRDKYAALQSRSLNQVDWATLQPEKPFYLFAPQDVELLEEYEKGWKITEAMTTFSVGIVSGQDKNVVGITINETKKLADKVSIGFEKIKKLNYRPFDKRFVLYDNKVVTRPRIEIMRHFYINNNIGFHLCRQISTDEWKHILLTDEITDDCFVSNMTSERGYSFPLYLYTTPEDSAGTLFAQSGVTRRANLSPAFVQALSQKLGLPFIEDPLPASPEIPGGISGEEHAQGAARPGFTPEDVFHYAYAVFHSPTYRARYAEFLKIDFPRLPLTGDRHLFFALAAKGRALTALHLLKTPLVENFITSYPAAGSNRVEKVAFVSETNPDPAGSESVGRVWINNTQYFGGVPEAVWNFKVGGYQVCDKWLKDRKGRTLSGDDISHYQRVVVALHETMRLMQEIDQIIPGFPLE